MKIWQKSKINNKYCEDNIFKFNKEKPNENFIQINSSKSEQLLKLERKNDIIDKPNFIKIKKVKKSIKKISGKSQIKKNILSKYFINEDGEETNLILERKLIMKKPVKKIKKEI